MSAPTKKRSGAREGRTPTKGQYGTLLPLASGSAGLSRTKRDTDPLLKHGWVVADWRPPYYQFVRITPGGLRALALAVERYGLPSMKPTRRSVERRVCADCGSSSYRITYIDANEAIARPPRRLPPRKAA